MSEGSETFEEWEVLDRVISAVSACKHLLQGSNSLDADGYITLNLSDFKESCGFTDIICEKIFKGESRNAHRFAACALRFNLKLVDLGVGVVPSRGIKFVLDKPPPSLSNFCKNQLELVNGNHREHDTFVREYVRSSGYCYDPVEVALRAKLEELASAKPTATKFAQAELSDRISGVPTTSSIRKLALYILLDQYPEQWAVALLPVVCYRLLCSILQIIEKAALRTKPEDNLYLAIFPPKWTQQVFRLENLVSPDQIKAVIFGMDPVSHNPENQSNLPDKFYKDFATGYAFAYDDLPADLKDSEYFCLKEHCSSAHGLVHAYGVLPEYLSDAGLLEKDITVKYGIALINFIRTIQWYSNSGSKNDFKDAWSEYNYYFLTKVPALINHTPQGQGSQVQIAPIAAPPLPPLPPLSPTPPPPPVFNSEKVLIFQNEKHKFDDVSDGEAFKKVKKLLVGSPRCWHPSHVAKITPHHRNCCNPHTSSENREKSNNSVSKFWKFLEQFNTGGIPNKLVRCCDVCKVKINMLCTK